VRSPAVAHRDDRERHRYLSVTILCETERPQYRLFEPAASFDTAAK
jgi:hypothetical protein